MNRLRSASILALASLAFAAQAQIVRTVGVGTAVTTATNAATFDGVATGTNLAAYEEGGLSITVDNSAYTGFNPNANNPIGGFSGGFFYGISGQDGATKIARVDGTMLTGVEMVLGTGYYSNEHMPDAKYFAVRNGSVYDSGSFSVRAGSTVGFYDPLGFDALYIGAYGDADSASAATLGSFQAAAIDSVRAQAVPEPASMAALACGAVGLIRRRKKA